MYDIADDIKVQVRCPECRTMFHERVKRIVHGDRVTCPCCKTTMHFHGIDHHHAHEDLASFIRHVEARTRHPHY